MFRDDLAVKDSYVVKHDQNTIYSCASFPHGKPVNPFDWRKIEVTSLKANELRGIRKLRCEKVVSVLSGTVKLFVVDLRPDSPTKNKHVSVELSPGLQAFIPRGCGEALYAQEAGSILTLQTEVEDSVAEEDLMWDDASLSISWGLSKAPILTTRLSLSARSMKQPEEPVAFAPSGELASQASRVEGKLPRKIWYAPNFFEAFGDEEIRAVVEALRYGALVSGPRTEEFEELVAGYFGKRHALFVNSGSSANLIGLAVLDLPQGAEVVTPACTFATTVAPIEQLGLTPVFVDVELDRYVPSVEAIIRAITAKTRVLMIPNLVGSKVDWQELRKRVTEMGRDDIILFEDSCDTMARTPYSDIAAISFYASHVITAGGIGGCVLFNKKDLLSKALQYRDWGRVGSNVEEVSERFAHSVDGIEYDFKFLYSVKGYNLKCSEMNAAFGVVQMRKLEKLQEIRRRNIQRYMDRLKGGPFVLPAQHDQHDWLAMPLQYHDRSGLLRFLEGNNVQVRCTFSGNVTRHPAFRAHFAVFPNADTIMKNGFLVGAHHGMSLVEVDQVCDLLLEYVRAK